jgi:hypothetical protein
MVAQNRQPAYAGDVTQMTAGCISGLTMHSPADRADPVWRTPSGVLSVCTTSDQLSDDHLIVGCNLPEVGLL